MERAEFERANVARELKRWERPLRITDRSLSFVRTLRRAPVLGVAIGAGMAALAFVRPGTLVDWIPGGRIVWQLLMAFLSQPAADRRRP
jgi:hypothetical protein